MIPGEGIPMEMEACVSTPDCFVELKSYDWNTADFVRWRHPSASIALVINRPASTRIHWRVSGKRQLIETGLFAAVPGNMDYHVQQDLGIKRTVTCAVKDDHFADVTGVDADWFNPEFVNRLAYDDAAPRRILSAIGDELMTPRLARDVSIEGYCLVLLSEVARIAGRIKTEEGRSSAGLSRGQIDRLRELIEAKLHERLSVGMMADELGMSRGHLSRLFKATTGSTLKGYVESARLARIETLLAHSSLPLKTIASRVGLSSANYLSVAFARRSGMSPRQYRRSRAS